MRARSGRLATVLTVAVAVLCGIGVALQSRVNGELGSRVQDGFAAAIVSFGGGLVLIGIVVAISRRGRAGMRQVVHAVRVRRIPVWYLLGGSAGALFVLSQGLTAGILGVALFTIGAVAGQTLGGLIVDRRGIAAVAPKPFTVRRVGGSIIMLVAVGIAVSAQLSTSVPLWMLAFPLVAGGALSWQQAVNGQVRQVANSAPAATLVNFLVGTAALVIAFVINVGIQGWPTGWPSEPWLYTGGVIGVLFIAAAAAIVGRIGVLLLGLAMISGQLVASLVLNTVAATASAPTASSTVIGAALALVAVFIVAAPRRARE